MIRQALAEGRAPVAPHSLEAEWGVLGAVIWDNVALRDLHGQIRGEHFYEPCHGRLFDAAMSAHAAGRLFDLPMAIKTAEGDPAFAELGGRSYLIDLVNKAPATNTAIHNARLVVDMAMRRGLIEVVRETGHELLHETPETTADELAARAEARLGGVLRAGGLGDAWASPDDLADAVSLALSPDARPPFLTTGLVDNDAAIGGIRPGKLTVIAGRPGMGKSAAALGLMRAAARVGTPSAMFSLEMDRAELALRMACDEAFDRLAPIYSGLTTNPTYFGAESGRLTTEQREQLLDASGRMRRWPVHFDCRTGLTPGQIVPAAKRLVRRWEREGRGPGLIVVDHLHIVRPEIDRHGNRAAEVGDVSAALRDLAKDTGAAVVAMCQLNRQVEARGNTDKRPQLADLRWSGEVEQDAYLIGFLYRPEYYLRKPTDPADLEAEVEYRAALEKVRNRLHWIWAKNRGGPTAEVETFCAIGCNAIRDLVVGGEGLA